MIERNYLENLRVVKLGILFCLLTLLYGFGLGIGFGAFEDDLKKHLKSSAEAVFDSKYEGSTRKMKKITDKSWTYFKRAHLHANGLGTSSLVLILLLSSLPTASVLKIVTALFLGLGSFGYSLFWMFAGLRAPGMGSTGAAKESLKWLAMPSSGLCVLGLCIVFVLTCKYLFIKTIKIADSSGQKQEL